MIEDKVDQFILDTVNSIDKRLGHPDGRATRNVFVGAFDGYRNPGNRTWFFCREGSPNKLSGFMRYWPMGGRHASFITNYGVFKVDTETGKISGPKKPRRLD
jgi:hypothetical protein